MWSAAVDPCVLTARATRSCENGAPLFDARSASVRLVRGPGLEHLVIDGRGEPVRLDVFGDSLDCGPATLRFEVADDERFEAQVAAIRIFRGAIRHRRNLRLAGQLFALLAVDARNAGASLRETADSLLGPGEWPGDGEHRKSLVRRLVSSGDRMIRSGPRAILARC